MHKSLIGFILLLVLCTGVGTLAAQEEPQTGSPEENACNPGGVLYREENQDGCPTEWHWKAGWFLAEYLSGDLPREDFPDEFSSALPSIPEPPALIEGQPTPEPVITICHIGSSYDTIRLCINSDHIGAAYQVSDGVKMADMLLVETLPCPTEFDGVSFNPGMVMTNTVELSVVALYHFTPEELISLKLTPAMHICEYPWMPS